MALDLFPSLIGLDWGTRMTPNFNNKIAKAANGYETRTNLQDQPLWDFELNYEFLPNRRNGIADLEEIQAFYLNCRGAFKSFLFDNLETPMENGTSLGTGDGTNKDFLLIRTTGSFGEIAGGVYENTDVLVYVNGTPQAPSAWTLVDHRTVRFVTAPIAGASITADYKPLFRVRFSEDSVDFENFMYRLWNLQQVELKGVFL